MKKFNEKKIIAELMQYWEYIYFFAEDPNVLWEISWCLISMLHFNIKLRFDKKYSMDYKQY